MLIARPAACSPRSRRTSTPHRARARPHRHHRCCARAKAADAAARCQRSSRRARGGARLRAAQHRRVVAACSTAHARRIVVTRQRLRRDGERLWPSAAQRRRAMRRRPSASRRSRAIRSRSSPREWKRLAPQVAMDHGPQRVAFHSPCTLQHGLRLRGAGGGHPAGGGLQLTPVADAHLCCGSAGTYSILQPELAERLGAQAGRARGGQPEVIATANIGCLTHLATGPASRCGTGSSCSSAAARRKRRVSANL